MKRIVLLILITVISLCCAGCIPKSGSAGEPDDGTGQLAAQQISDGAALASDLLQAAREAYRKELEAYSPLGNAGELDGRIVIFTVFASGTDYRWDLSKQEDADQKHKCLEDLSEAAAYLTDQAAGYGRDVEFLYDWEADPGLAVEYSADHPMANTARTREIAYELAPARLLKEKYDAGQVIYLFLVNTDYENTKRSHANWYDPQKTGENASLTDLTEYVKINLRSDYGGEKWDAQSSTYAHEILHLFGVPDLYEAGTLITQEYADHMDVVMSTARYPDIMYGGVAGWSVRSHVFSEVDAYYAGLTDLCGDVGKYGLGKSQHLTDQ